MSRHKNCQGELVHLILKGQVSPPDTPPLTLETSTACKHGAGIIKMKDAESLRVKTTYGLEVFAPGLPQAPRVSPIILQVSQDVYNSLQGLPVLVKNTLTWRLLIRDQSFLILACRLHKQGLQNANYVLSIKSRMAINLCAVQKRPAGSLITAFFQ